MTADGLRVVLIAGPLETANDDAVRLLAERLAGSGVAVRVVGLAGGRDWRSDVPLVRAPGLARAWSRPWAVRQAEFLREPDGRVDLLHAIGEEAAEAVLALAEHHRLPYLLSLVEFPTPEPSLRTSRRWCRRILATGDDLAAALLRQLGIPESAMVVIPPGIETHPDEHLPLVPGRVPVIGAAGTSDPASGLATFLTAARAVLRAGIDAEFVIAGEGPDEANILRLASHLGIAERVTFVQDRVETRRYWRVLDVYCQASLVPCTGRELSGALANGIPAIVSNVPGLRAWIVPEQTGLLVEPGDAEGLAAGILGLLADPERAARLGNNARAWVAAHCDPAREVALLTDLYHAVTRPAEVPAPLKVVRRDVVLRG
jgi:glycosyltransferase involved in cell wall biosynthesis